MIVAVVREPPRIRPFLDALLSAGPGLHIDEVSGGSVLVLYGGPSPGEPLLWIQAPLEVEVPWEAERLLGVAAECPSWWVMIDSVDAGLADRFTGSLVSRLGGIVVTDPPVVGMTTARGDHLRRGGNVVTSSSARLTGLLALSLQELGRRWVVDAEPRYDGLTGAMLTPDLASTGRIAPASTGGSASGWQLILKFRIRHPASEGLSMGGATETVYRHLTGEPPGGWGTAEPAARMWNRAELTGFCRARAPKPTWTVHVGSGERPALGMTLVTRGTAGVDENVTVLTGYRQGEPVPNLAGLVGSLGSLVQLTAIRRPGNVDLTVEPRFVGSPEPIGLALGPAAKAVPRGVTGFRSRRVGDSVLYETEEWPAFGRLVNELAGITVLGHS